MKIDFAKRLLDTTIQQQQDEERQLQSKQSEMERKIGLQLQAKNDEELKLEWMPDNMEKLKERIELMKKDQGQRRSKVASYEEALELDQRRSLPARIYLVVHSGDGRINLTVCLSRCSSK
jgi:hypothetical protein